MCVHTILIVCSVQIHIKVYSPKYKLKYILGTMCLYDGSYDGSKPEPSRTATRCVVREDQCHWLQIMPVLGAISSEISHLGRDCLKEGKWWGVGGERKFHSYSKIHGSRQLLCYKLYYVSFKNMLSYTSEWNIGSPHHSSHKVWGWQLPTAPGCGQCINRVMSINMVNKASLR